MKKIAICTIIISCALSRAPWAGAALPENDKVFKAMKDEMTRSMDKLRMDSLAKPYFLDYQVVEGQALGIAASFGAVESEYTAPYRRLRVDLRVGSPAFDNSNYAPNVWEGYRVETDWAVALEDNYDSLRYSIWAATDKAYKKALETHSKKKAYKESKNITELFDDMTPRPPYQLFRDAAQETPGRESLAGEHPQGVGRLPEISGRQVFKCAAQLPIRERAVPGQRRVRFQTARLPRFRGHRGQSLRPRRLSALSRQ